MKNNNCISLPRNYIFKMHIFKMTFCKSGMARENLRTGTDYTLLNIKW